MYFVFSWARCAVGGVRLLLLLRVFNVCATWTHPDMFNGGKKSKSDVRWTICTTLAKAGTVLDVQSTDTWRQNRNRLPYQTLVQHNPQPFTKNTLYELKTTYPSLCSLQTLLPIPQSKTLVTYLRISASSCSLDLGWLVGLKKRHTPLTIPQWYLSFLGFQQTEWWLITYIISPFSQSLWKERKKERKENLFALLSPCSSGEHWENPKGFFLSFFFFSFSFCRRETRRGYTTREKDLVLSFSRKTKIKKNHN